jgi:hypothetical protein
VIAIFEMNPTTLTQIAEFAGGAVTQGNGGHLIAKISTDSRTVAGTTLSREFELAESEMGMTEDELLRCNLTAYEARFGR